MKNDKVFQPDRVVGLDSHPDSFTAAFLRGATPAAAVIEKTFEKVPLDRLASWASKHTTERDLFVLEASGNSFQVVRTLQQTGQSAGKLSFGQTQGKPRQQ